MSDALTSIAHRRLHQQRLLPPTCSEPGDVVTWLGAVQAQDFLGSLWSLAMRIRRTPLVEADVEKAISDRSIVRMWFMRGTLHFLPAADTRWMLKLMAPRMQRMVSNSSRSQKLELEEDTFCRANDLFAAELEGGRQATRTELQSALENAGIKLGGQRFAYLLSRAQADGILCYGPRRGKQLTFALFDEWVPERPDLDQESAVAELVRRYFTSHGPATIKDFVWWSGLTGAGAKAGLDAAGDALVSEQVDGQTYWGPPGVTVPPVGRETAYLLPTYDEYLISYKDRSASISPDDVRQWGRGGLFMSSIVVGGRVIGTWRRQIKRNSVELEAIPFRPEFSGTEREAIGTAAARYGEYLGLDAKLRWA